MSMPLSCATMRNPFYCKTGREPGRVNLSVLQQEPADSIDEINRLTLDVFSFHAPIRGGR
jgi:hypothetical protein